MAKNTKLGNLKTKTPEEIGRILSSLETRVKNLGIGLKYPSSKYKNILTPGTQKMALDLWKEIEDSKPTRRELQTMTKEDKILRIQKLDAYLRDSLAGVEQMRKFTRRQEKAAGRKLKNIEIESILRASKENIYDEESIPSDYIYESVLEFANGGLAHTEIVKIAGERYSTDVARSIVEDEFNKAPLW